MDPLYGVQGNLPKFPCKQYKGKHFLNFDNVPVKVYLKKLDFWNLLIKIFNLVPKFRVYFHRKIFTKWAPHSALVQSNTSILHNPSCTIRLIFPTRKICTSGRLTRKQGWLLTSDFFLYAEFRICDNLNQIGQFCVGNYWQLGNYLVPEHRKGSVTEMQT